MADIKVMTAASARATLPFGRLAVTAEGKFYFGDSSGLPVEVANANHLHAGVYEPTFSKNTAFNKNFGTAAGTVSEGNHSHASVYLGITAKAADSDKLDGYDSIYYAMITPSGTWHHFTDPNAEESGYIDGSWVNRFDYFPRANILVETSSNGVDFSETTEYSDSTIQSLVGGDTAPSISIPNLGTVGSAYKRFTFTPNQYVSLSSLYIWSTKVTGTLQVKVEKRWAADATWRTVCEWTDINGWPSHHVLKHSAIWFNTSNGYHDRVRITFYGQTTDPTYINHSIRILQWWGGYPAAKRTPYSFDYLKNMSLPAGLTVAGATTFNSTINAVGDVTIGSDIWMNGAGHDIKMNQNGNGQEWSHDFYRNGYTGGYWHIWDSSLGTLLAVYAETGKVMVQKDLEVVQTLTVDSGSTLKGDVLMYDGTSLSPELKFQNTSYVAGIDFNSSKMLRLIDRSAAASRIEFDLANSRIWINDANTQIGEGAGNSIKLFTNYGWCEIGPQNDAWNHFKTDRAANYFDKPLYVNGQLSPYNFQNTYMSNSTGYIAELGQRVYSPNNKPSLSDLGVPAWAQQSTLQASDVPGLDASKIVSGTLSYSVLPAIAITKTTVVSSEALMLAISPVPQEGDICVRTDINKTFICNGGDPTVIAGWTQFLTPTDLIQSVNGKTGVVVLNATDVGAAAEGHTHDDRYFTESEITTFLAAKQDASTAINTSNIGSQSVNYAAGAGNADTLDNKHASDFSLVGHAHAFSEITSKPTTLSGYGITNGLKNPVSLGSGNSNGTVSISPTSGADAILYIKVLQYGDVEPRVIRLADIPSSTYYLSVYKGSTLLVKIQKTSTNDGIVLSSIATGVTVTIYEIY